MLVVDWKMPGMTGLELVKDIKDGAPEKVPSVVMVTSHGAEAVRDALNKNLVDGLLIKPIGISTLNDTIADVLQQDHRRMRSQQQEVDYMELYRQHLKGVRLLLVEDNEINMDLATELLEDVGAHVDAAVNGIMAVEMTQGQSYDLVLMDIQMPEMDGLTATREIRTRIKADELPIVAMTAHAIKGEYEKSLAAGMNDHITKPIDPDVLYRTLVKHIRGISMDSIAPEGAERTKSAIQISGLKYEEGLKRSGSKRASYHALLLKFSNRYVNVATEVRTMVMNSDVAGLSDYLHTLAGVSGNVGATEAYELSSKLSVHMKSAKEAGEQKIRVDLISQMQLLSVRVDELISAIRENIMPEVADKRVTKESAERNWSEFAMRLKASVSENDTIALDMLDEALSKGGEEAVVQCLKEVQISLSDFNFDKALEQINRGLEEGLFR